MKTIYILLLTLALFFYFPSKAQSCTGLPSTPFVSVTGSGPYTLTAHTGTTTGLTYQWYASTMLSGPYAAILGSTGSTTTTPILTLPQYYVVGVTCTSSARTSYSCPVLVTIDTCLTPIISLSKSTPICASDTIIFSSSITDACYLYQWQDSLLGDITGATTPSLKIIPPTTATKTYRLKFTCPYGTTYSSWLTINPHTTCDTATITISKTIGCTGDTLHLSGTGISPCAALQWEDTLSGAITGATNATLNIAAPSTYNAYRLKSTCPLGKVSYSNWINFTPYACDTPLVSISATGGCSGDTLMLYATGVSPCATLQWEDSLSGTIAGATDSTIKIVAPGIHDSYRLKTTCSSGVIYYSGWLPYTPYTTCGDSVWAGDVNWDLTVDYLDLLDLGVAYGSTGTTRPGASISWVAQYAKNWTSYFPSTVNYKNADCDGNGVVNDDDTLAIYTNYSSVHSIGIIVPKYPKTTGLPDLYFDLSGLAPKAGDIITVPVKLGNASLPFPKIYGIATRIYIDGLTLTTPPGMDYSTSWVGTPKYKLSLTNNPNMNEVDGTYVRKDNNNTAGYGTIGLLTIQIPATTPDKTIMRFNFLSAKIIDKLGNELGSYNILSDSLMITTPLGINEQNASNYSKFYVYPNPSDGNIIIMSAGNNSKKIAVTVYDLLGGVLLRQPLNFTGNKSNLKIDVLTGTYILELRDEDGNVFRERINIH